MLDSRLTLKEQEIINALSELAAHLNGSESLEQMAAAVRAAEQLRASYDGSPLYQMLCSDFLGALKTAREDALACAEAERAFARVSQVCG